MLPHQRQCASLATARGGGFSGCMAGAPLRARLAASPAAAALRRCRPTVAPCGSAAAAGGAQHGPGRTCQAVPWRHGASPLLAGPSQLRRCRSGQQHGLARRGGTLVARASADPLVPLGFDFLTFLASTVLVIPLFKHFKLSPVLGFLVSGVVLKQLGYERGC